MGALNRRGGAVSYRAVVPGVYGWRAWSRRKAGPVLKGKVTALSTPDLASEWEVGGQKTNECHNDNDYSETSQSSSELTGLKKLHGQMHVTPNIDIIIVSRAIQMFKCVGRRKSTFSSAHHPAHFCMERIRMARNTRVDIGKTWVAHVWVSGQ